LLNFHRHNH